MSKKIRNLEQKVKSAILGGVLGISSLVYSGCETAEDSAWFGALAGANAGLASTPQQAAAWGALSQGAQTSAIIQGQREAAEIGRSEVNVNLNYQQQTQQSSSIEESVIDSGKMTEEQSSSVFNEYIEYVGNVAIIACNYVTDFNNDEKFNYYNVGSEIEFKGIRKNNSFSDKENITVGLSIYPNKIFNEYTMKVWDRNGKLIKEDLIKKTSLVSFTFEAGKLEEGIYTVGYYVKGIDSDRVDSDRVIEYVNEKTGNLVCSTLSAYFDRQLFLGTIDIKVSASQNIYK